MDSTQRIVLGNKSFPVLAVSAKWYGFPDHFEWLVSRGFALEYTPDKESPTGIRDHTTPFLDRGVRIRHHGFFPGFEFGDKDPEKADLAMKRHFQALDAIVGIGEPVITFHAGLTRNVEIDPNRACDNLGQLVEYAKNRGITVSLENLKQGLTSNPYTVRKWADAADAMITMDIGHAVSSNWRIQNNVSVVDIIDLFEDRLIEVHLYERETDRHYPPENMEILGVIIDRLLQTDCPWWTIELEDHQEILQTQRLVSDYIESKSPESFSNA